MTVSVGGDEAHITFAPHRPQLVRVAYRMLASVSDAEDVVQEAFIRWMRTDRTKVVEPAAFLRSTVMRLCLDHIKAVRRRRESYVGPWLPDPVVDDGTEDVTLPLMLALERLSPLERAAFLLHDVFGTDFDVISGIIGRDARACRQLASRARKNVRSSQPRFGVERQRGLELAEAFFTASRSGDMTALSAMLAADVFVQSDGGGKRAAAIEPITGFDAVLQVHRRLASLFSQVGSTLVQVCFINGVPGFVSREADGLLQTTALLVDRDEVVAIYVVRNPDKLRHLS